MLHRNYQERPHGVVSTGNEACRSFCLLIDALELSQQHSSCEQAPPKLRPFLNNLTTCKTNLNNRVPSHEGNSFCGPLYAIVAHLPSDSSSSRKVSTQGVPRNYRGNGSQGGTSIIHVAFSTGVLSTRVILTHVTPRRYPGDLYYLKDPA